MTHSPTDSLFQTANADDGARPDVKGRFESTLLYADEVLVTPTNGSQQTLADALAAGGGNYPRVISDTIGTLAAADNGNAVQCINSAAVTLTVPAGLGPFQCLVLQMNTGAVTPTTDGTTVIQPAGTVTTNGQYSMISVVSTSADNFVVGGNSTT